MKFYVVVLFLNNGIRQIIDGKGTFLNGEWKVLNVKGKYIKTVRMLYLMHVKEHVTMQMEEKYEEEKFSFTT